MMPSFTNSLPQRAGIGLRQPHWRAMADFRPATGFLEIHAENFLDGRSASVLDDLRRDYPFSVHAVGLSLASAEGIDTVHLDRVAALAERTAPMLVSDHLCWSAQDGIYFNDLLPFPYTHEALRIVAANIDKVQERLRRPILIENISAYVRFHASALSEGQFMAELVARTGCGILCDVNNAYVNQANHGTDALEWLRALPPAAVQEIHLAGHCANAVEGSEMLIDDHGAAVIEPVWALYAEAVKLFPRAATLVEWDTNIPALDILLGEARKADLVREKTQGAAHATAA